MRLSAGTTPCGAGWQSVGRLWRAVRGGLVPAGKIAHRISSPAPSATFIGGGFCMHARSPAMTQPYSPAPHPIQDVPANGPVLDPNTLIALLHSIGSGAASDGQPWPERHQMPGRRIALADTDCSLAGLRVVLEILLAAQRARENGELEQYVGPRVMEGLIMAGLGLTAHASTRVRPDD